MHKKLKEHRERQLQREYDKAFDEAKRKGLIERAQREGYEEGLTGEKGRGSFLGKLEKAKGAMDAVQGFLVGDDFEFAAASKDKKKRDEDLWSLI